MIHDKNKLRLIFIDVLRGYSIRAFGKDKIFIKHQTSFDSGDADHKKEEFKNKAIQGGLPTIEDQDKYIIKEKLWSEEKNKEIDKIGFYISNLKTTKSKLFRSEEIKSINVQINEENLKLNKLKSEKKELIGFTAEDYANKKINEYYIKNSLYKDENLKNTYFSENEFDELEDKDIVNILKIYDEFNKDFFDKNLKKIALSPFYLNLFNISEDNPYYFYGKPIMHLTFYQVEVFGYARYFKSIITEAKNKPSDDLYEDPDKLIDWLESSRNLEEVLDKNVSKENKKSEGAVGTSIIGASKEDLEKINKNQKGVSLHQEALKKGGVLSMEDLMKLHGVK